MFLQQYCLPLRCDAQRKPLPESPGRHFALPVAYLSKVTHHLSRCLKKTPASTFTPKFTRPYFISTSTEVTFPFSSPLQIPQGENGMLSLYLRELQPGHVFVYIFKKSRRNFRDSTDGFMLTRPWQTHPRCQQISAPQRCGSCWANPGRTSCSHR